MLAEAFPLNKNSQEKRKMSAMKSIYIIDMNYGLSLPLSIMLYSVSFWLLQ